MTKKFRHSLPLLISEHMCVTYTFDIIQMFVLDSC